MLLRKTATFQVRLKDFFGKQKKIYSTTGKHETGLNGRRKLSKLRKMSLEMEVTL